MKRFFCTVVNLGMRLLSFSLIQIDEDETEEKFHLFLSVGHVNADVILTQSLGGLRQDTLKVKSIGVS